MLGKIALLLHGKAATVALGALVVTGAGTAVTVATVNGQIPALAHIFSSEPISDDGAHHHTDASTGATQPTETATPETPTATETPDTSKSEDHTVSGKLVSYDAQSGTMTINSDNARGMVTVFVNAETRVVGDHVSSLADLANALNHQVEVSTTVQSDGSLLAVKVAVGDDGSDNQQGEQTLSGVVASVDANGFTVTLESGDTVSVSVDATTTFSGSVSGLADLAAGMKVEVDGVYQSDGTVAAASVQVDGENSVATVVPTVGDSGDSGDSHDGSTGGVGILPTPND